MAFASTRPSMLSAYPTSIAVRERVRACVTKCVVVFGVMVWWFAGMIFAIAHIRGGGEMGRHWYEKEGKYLNKRNTFTDFCNCAEFLIAQGYTRASELAISGRSAGGLLMGAVLNLRPDLYRAAVAGVPFVDIMVTMSDPTIPLTITEWEEWGNPNEKTYFDYMMSYRCATQPWVVPCAMQDCVWHVCMGVLLCLLATGLVWSCCVVSPREREYDAKSAGSPTHAHTRSQHN
jgi:hypothetical protein